ncbi:CocE/NonD family hydrolase C-terminal non-catalytic domain-containing protein [Nocardia sp. NBC_00511]|uniref:CocE/NonD family hydrolase C-terminal non-catalytic domain-containing protein n=1 Tax=Nocardia sp. NBC_00511 TaxID=2903591 RepID=UPI0030E35B8B
MVPGQITEYDVKIRPAFHVFASGHRLQVTLASGDAPTHILNPKDYPSLLGGSVDIQRGADAASYLTVPLAPVRHPR